MGRPPSPETARVRERIFRFVRERILSGRPPTVREVQEAFGFAAVQSARMHLEALVAAGRLRKEPGVSRGYRLPEEALRLGRRGPPPSSWVPVLGRVQAGALHEAIETPDGWVPAPPRDGGEGLLALRVRGDSMVGLGIREGDLVLVRRQADAQPGDVVVALLGGEATVKTLRFGKGGRPELHAANPAYAPIVPEEGELSLLGKVVELRRYLEGGPEIELPAAAAASEEMDS
jgi:repressor LexA